MTKFKQIPPYRIGGTQEVVAGLGVPLLIKVPPFAVGNDWLLLDHCLVCIATTSSLVNIGSVIEPVVGEVTRN